MAEPTLTYEGVTYAAPTRPTIGELAEATKMGARFPTSADDAPDPLLLAWLLLIAKRRAGENVDPNAMLDVVAEDIGYDAGSQNGNGHVIPPTSGADGPGRNKAKRGK